MAINLSQLSRPTSGKPVVVTLFGEAGTGKTTLAAMFPRPVFIRTEDGTASLDGHPDALLFPVAKTTKDVFDAIEALATQEHDRKTLVFDSVTQYEKIATREDFKNGLALYMQREFPQACDQFQRVIDFNPADSAARIYYDRALSYAMYGPPPDWEPVEALDSK